MDERDILGVNELGRNDDAIDRLLTNKQVNKYVYTALFRCIGYGLSKSMA